MAHFDLNLIKRLAYQRLQQIALKQNEKCGMNGQTTTTTTTHTNTNPTNIDINNSSSIETVIKEENIDNETMSPNLVSKLDVEYVINESRQPVTRQIDNELGKEMVGNCNGFSVGIFDDIKSFVPSLIKLEPGISTVRCRAALTPINDYMRGDKWYTDTTGVMNDAVPMRYRSLTIGTGPGNDVILGLYGKCGRISTKHAVIFYDEVTRYYELLNYSEHGTEVNGQMYSCNLTEFKQIPVNVPQSIIEANASAEKNAQEIIDKRRGVIRETYQLGPNAK